MKKKKECGRKQERKEASEKGQSFCYAVLKAEDEENKE